MTDSAESLLREAHEYLRLVEDGYSSVMDTQNNLLHRIDAHLASNPAGEARLNAAPPTSRLEGQRESDVKASCNDRPDDCRALAEKPDSHPTPEQNAAQAWAVFGLNGNILLYTISAYENQAWSRTGHRTGSTCRRVLITEAPAHD